MGNVIAIVGMTGSGKSIASDYLEKKGYYKIYFGGLTLSKLKEAGLEINPENEKMMREKLRKEHGMGAFAKLLLPQIKEQSQKHDVVLDGLYSWDEFEILNNELDDLKLIGIIVDKDIRYERVSQREIRPLTNIEAERRDVAEIKNSAKGGPIAFADYYIFNNGTMNSYYKRLNEIIDDIESNGGI